MNIVIDVLRGVGLVLLVMPLILHQFIHGNYERYIWLLSGPKPFSSFGSGPFQVYMYFGLVVSGLIILSIAYTIKGIITKIYSCDR